jgi:hypothetical protein
MVKSMSQKEKGKLSEKKKAFEFEMNFWAIIILYLVVILAGAVSIYLGIAAFICITVLLLGIFWLSIKH